MNRGELRERRYGSTQPVRMLFGFLVVVALVAPLVRGLEANWQFVAIGLGVCIVASAVDRRAAQLSDHGKARAISSMNTLGFLFAAEVLVINIEIDPSHHATFLAKYMIVMGLSLAQLVYLARATTPFWRDAAAKR
jgi:hypothetical protein